ncbi:hypothetical protein FKG94_16950 [Exilibacterium tricleocarpae]|uniref:Uncharacterized protein n=1 Tax=Exilibacterium tricleocarpae TaxID=2591008 RepID=A0A545T848_9GAMM|nr:hypothetical protein [Exilibacterium tricleocarpae]TQV73392.1 hypothetical protein FKG94_16950 [Exilibacterium tricleocarpae]
MDPVNGLSQIVQILRQKLAERSSATRRLRDGAPAGTDTGPKPAAKSSLADIKRKIGERIRALPDEEREEARAVQVFVEAVMVWEFGDQLLQDPQFSALSKEVAQSMADHPQISQPLRLLIREFRSSW